MKRKKVPLRLLSEGKVALRYTRKLKFFCGQVLTAAFPNDSLNMLGYRSTPIIADPHNPGEWDHASHWKGLQVIDPGDFSLHESIGSKRSSLYREMLKQRTGLLTAPVRKWAVDDADRVVRLIPHDKMAMLIHDLQENSSKTAQFIPDNSLIEAMARVKPVDSEVNIPFHRYTVEDVQQGKCAIFTHGEDFAETIALLERCFPGSLTAKNATGDALFWYYWRESRPDKTICSSNYLPETIPVQCVCDFAWEDRQPVPATPLDKPVEAINHPPHYNVGRIEVIDFIEDQKLGFHLGNAVKYIARAGKKDPVKEIQDIEKAIWYLKRFIELNA